MTEQPSTACSATSRRRTRTTGWTRSRRSRPPCPAAPSTSRSAPRATRRRPMSSPRCGHAGRGDGLPRVDRLAGLAQGLRPLGRAPVRGHRRRRQGDRGLRRHQGVRGHDAAVPEAAHARARHRAVPGDQLPDLRDGRDPGPVSGVPYQRAGDHQGRRRRAPPLSPLGGLSRIETDPASSHDLGAAAGWGRERGRPGALGRVLRRVQLDARPAGTILQQRHGRGAGACTRCPSATTSPAPGSASTPATPSWCTTCARCASTPG